MKIVTNKEKNNMLVDICKGCRKKDEFCKCLTGNILNVYSSDIYVKKALRIIIQEGVVADLSGNEIVSNINNYIKDNLVLEAKKNLISNDYKFVYKYKSK